jgi:hypothetical protein
MEKKQQTKSRTGAHNKPDAAPAATISVVVKSDKKSKANLHEREKKKEAAKPQSHKNQKTKNVPNVGKTWKLGGQVVTKSADKSVVAFVSNMHSYKPSPVGLGRMPASSALTQRQRLAGAAIRFVLDAAGKTVWASALCGVQSSVWHSLNDIAALHGGPDALFGLTDYAASQLLTGETLALYDLLKFALMGPESGGVDDLVSGASAILKEVASGFSPTDVVRKLNPSVAMPYEQAARIEAPMSPGWKPVAYLLHEGDAADPDDPLDDGRYRWDKNDWGTPGHRYSDWQAAYDAEMNGTEPPLNPEYHPSGSLPRTGFTNVESHTSGYHTSYDVIETPYGHGLVLKGEQVLGYVNGGTGTGLDIKLSSSMATVNLITGGGGFVRLGVDTLGGRLASVARLYQRYMFESVQLNWEPDVATTVNGSLAFAMDADGDGPGVTPFAQAPTYEECRILPTNMVTSYWYPKSLDWKCPAMKDWLYTYGNGGSSVADNRMTNASTIYVRPSATTPSTMINQSYGFISMKYTLVLAGPTSDLGFTLSGAVAKQLGPSHVDDLAQVIMANPVPFYEMCKNYGFSSVVLDPAHQRLRQKLVDLGVLTPFIDTPYEAWARRQISLTNRVLKPTNTQPALVSKRTQEPLPPSPSVPSVAPAAPRHECAGSCSACYVLVDGKPPVNPTVCFRGTL